MKYLVLIHNNPDVLDDLTPEERTRAIGGDELIDKARRLRDSGELLSVLQLQEPTASKTVQVVDGAAVVSDRPFLETKEFLAGALLVECVTIDRAVEIAAELPFAALQRIEVRPTDMLDADGMLELLERASR